MKRFALLVTTVIASAGCTVDTCDPVSLKVNWSFVDVAGVAGRSCALVGVDYVDVWVDNVLVGDAVPCTDYGGTLQNIASGYRDLVVEGVYYDNVSASWVTVNRDWYTVNVADCGATTFNAMPGEADLEVAYAFDGVNVCSTPPTYMWLQLTDQIAGSSWGPSAADLCTDQKQFSCGSSIVYRVPYGDYTLDTIDEISFATTGTCSGPLSLAGSAAAVTVRVEVATPTTPVQLPVTLY